MKQTSNGIVLSFFHTYNKKIETLDIIGFKRKKGGNLITCTFVGSFYELDVFVPEIVLKQYDYNIDTLLDDKKFFFRLFLIAKLNLPGILKINFRDGIKQKMNSFTSKIAGNDKR